MRGNSKLKCKNKIFDQRILLEYFMQNVNSVFFAKIHVKLTLKPKISDFLKILVDRVK